jgi:PAS domain S-box-containing protein
MMKFLHDAPIHRKIGVTLLLATAAGLLVAGLAVLAYDLSTARPRVLGEAQAEARLLALNLHAALNFDDPDAAQENLSTLQGHPEVSDAAVYTATGRVFARYQRDPGADATPPVVPLRRGHSFQGDSLSVVEPIRYRGEVVGFIFLRYDILPLSARLSDYGILMGIVLLSLAVVWALQTGALKRTVSEPLLELAQGARQVKEQRQYGVRVVPRGEDEIGQLGRAFNDMLATIEQREISLQKTNADLESREVELRRELAERLRAEEALRVSEDHLRLAVEAGQIGTWDIDLVKDKLVLSVHARQMLGIPPDEELGGREHFRACVHPEDREATREAVRNSLELHQLYDHEFRAVWPDGSVHWLVAQGRGHYAPDGTPVRMTGVSIDITARKMAENEIRRLNETLEQRVAERTAVAEHRAHQLRVLTAELSQAEQRERRRLAQILHDHLQQLLVAAQLRMSRLQDMLRTGAEREAIRQIRELLRSSIQVSRNLTVDLSPPILEEAGLVPALEWLCRQFHEKYSLTVKLEAEPGASEAAHALRFFFFHAVRELLFNVVKHAGVDHAGLSAKIRDDKLRISVRDQGVGFREEPAGEQRDRFGLFSIRERLELLDGRLEVDSGAHGTRVTMVAPVREEVERRPVAAPIVQHPAQVAHLVARGSPAVPSQRIRIVLADDHKIVREGLAALLLNEPDMETIAEASNGEEAISLVRKLQPDLVVMDASMPIMNGVEATRRIKEEAPHVRVVGLSMFQSDEMASTMMAAGASAYITKDRASEVLVDVIRDQFGGKA